jgi:NADH-quinone oxidoreductase subunit J
VVLTIIALALMLIAAVWSVVTRSLVQAALSLAATSIILTILMFMLGASLAAVFELSVCAGLITVIFVSTIALTRPYSSAELRDKTRNRMKRYRYLPAIILVAGAVIVWLSLNPSIPPLVLPPPPAESAGAKEVLWGSRQTDLIGQILIIFAGAFGVIVLLKEKKGKKGGGSIEDPPDPGA